MIAIQECPFILERLRSLNREIVYSPYVFTAILVYQEDRDIVEKVRGRFLYLKGLTSPIQGMPENKFMIRGIYNLCLFNAIALPIGIFPIQNRAD
jgi:hypothetical protein